jgi:hypothetical protein
MKTNNLTSFFFIATAVFAGCSDGPIGKEQKDKLLKTELAAPADPKDSEIYSAEVDAPKETETTIQETEEKKAEEGTVKEPPVTEVVTTPPAPEPPPERYLRTGTQFVAAVAKSFGQKKSLYDGVYELVGTNLPGSSDVTSVTVHEGFWIATTQVAAHGCQSYIDKQTIGKKLALNNLVLPATPEQATAALTSDLNTVKDLIYLDPKKGEAAVTNALALTASITDRIIALKVGCAAMASTLVFY